jgi:DNA-binding MarR family transcriptional regulator
VSKARPVPFDKTLQVRDTCLCLHLQRAARAVARQFDDALRPAGLTSGQFSLLMALNRPEPPTISMVAAVLAMDRTTLTANLKPLERRGLIAQKVDAVDRRNRRLILTAEGQRALAAAVPIWDATHRAMEARVVDGDADSLRAALTALS